MSSKEQEVRTLITHLSKFQLQPNSYVAATVIDTMYLIAHSHAWAFFLPCEMNLTFEAHVTLQELLSRLQELQTREEKLLARLDEANEAKERIEGS
jgi:hypothetical protein